MAEASVPALGPNRSEGHRSLERMETQAGNCPPPREARNHRVRHRGPGLRADYLLVMDRLLPKPARLEPTVQAASDRSGAFVTREHPARA
jgi:hypothetical protein